MPLKSSNPIKTPKGQMKCNLCRKACQVRNGDWFLSTGTGDQQVFLCKECESAAKGSYRRASLPTVTRA